MREVARATSAAPTYFTPAKLETMDPLNYYALIDGGVVAGNPAMSAYAEAVRMMSEAQAGPGEILLLSLGTGELQHPLKYGDACDWGQLEWAQPVIDIVLQRIQRDSRLPAAAAAAHRRPATELLPFPG